jgi:hypothetical protein
MVATMHRGKCRAGDAGRKNLVLARLRVREVRVAEVVDHEEPQLVLARAQRVLAEHLQGEQAAFNDSG